MADIEPAPAPHPSAEPAPRAFMDALGQGIYGVDPAGLCLFINAPALRMLGYKRPQELIGRNMHQVIHHTRPDGTAFPQAECPLLRTAQDGRAVQLENEMLWRRDGTGFFAEYSAFPAWQDGVLVGSVITFVENKTRQDARIRLGTQHAISRILSATAEPEKAMPQVLGSIGGGFGWEVGLFWRGGQETAGFELDAHWEARRTGVAAALMREVAGGSEMTPGGLAACNWADGEPAYAATFVPGVMAGAHGLRGGVAIPVLAGKTVLGAMEFYGREPIGLDDALRETLAVLGHTVGQALERQQIGRVLRKSEARFRVIVDAVPQLVWMTGPDGAIGWYNARWYSYTGTTPQDMLGWGWKSVHHPDHLDRVVETFKASIASGDAWEDTFPLRGADGEYRWFLSRAMPIRAEAGDVVPQGTILGWFGTNTDITAMRDAERTQADALAAAEAANDAKSLFLANMSHELRTPLSAIIGYSEMLIEEIQDGAEPAGLTADIRKVETNARHLLGLINDVLDLSKVESGKMEAFAETFDVAAMVRDVAATVTSLIAKKGNRLALVLGDGLGDGLGAGLGGGAGLGTMHSDITRVRQVLLNLLSNAAKFTENGVITLSAHAEPGPDGTGWLRFAVSDTGLGMTEEQLGRLFQRFHQADASTTRKFGGTGLGLSLARAFGELLGGTVDARSQPGQGSTFTVHLPAALPAPATPEPRATEQAGDQAGQQAGKPRQTVLVIDDNATQRELIGRFLDRTGYAVQTAADGPAGLALARDMVPHAILLDVTMPGMDGWSVLTALKADPALADIPVVMVTLRDDRALASSLGAADYLLKPVNWTQLAHVMERFRAAEGDVLVVDDDPDVRERLRQVLERNGWAVTHAVHGQDALDQVEHAVPRLILLDLDMPVMDGFEFLRRLRDKPGCGTVPVVVLTALDLTLDDRRRLRGANQVLNKGSMSLGELVEKLRGIETLPPSRAPSRAPSRVGH